MIDYIGLYPNKYEVDFNKDIIFGDQDTSIISLIITEMMEVEAIENIKIESYEVIMDQDEIDINTHMVNINFKKKDLDSIEIPKSKYINTGRYGEIKFTIKVETNLNSKTIEKKILFPIEQDGFFLNNGVKMKAIWQLVDESTYSQRGKNTLKSRNPVVIYQNKKRVITDVESNLIYSISYSYALNNSAKKFSKASKKPKSKFINPLMLYICKMGIDNTLEFFNMNDIVFFQRSYEDYELEHNYIFKVDNLFIKVGRELYDKYDMIKSFVGMAYGLGNSQFPINMDLMNNKNYWVCRIGMIGASRNSNLSSFMDKGINNIIRIERLVNTVTKDLLRIPDYYKHNIYYIMYWLITNYNQMRRYKNTNLLSKRIRKNEYIVNSSLGKKLSENIAKVVERKSKSRMNHIDTLLEIFNFGSDIIIAGMRNLNDLIKTDDIVNDMDFLQSIAFSSKGYQSAGSDNNKIIADKYRDLDPSMVGRVDLNVSPNSDVGMSGSFTPYVELHDKFFFNEDHQPCKGRYDFDMKLSEDNIKKMKMLTFEEHLEYLENGNKFKDLLANEKIEIVEKEM